MNTVSHESAIFLWSVFCGFVTMIIYDFFSVPRRKNFSVFACNVFDATFVTVASAIMFFVVFSVANGCVRAYEFVGAFLGAVLYKITIGKIMSIFFYKIVNIISLIFAKIFNFLLTPIKIMYKIIYSIIGVVCRFILKTLRIASFSLKKT